MKMHEFITESPVTELSPEHREMFANDIEQLATEADLAAAALRRKDKKKYAEHWQELEYYILRIQKQAAQLK